MPRKKKNLEKEIPYVKEDIIKYKMEAYRQLIAAYLTANKCNVIISSEDDKLLYEYLYGEYPNEELEFTSIDNKTLKPTKAKTNIKDFKSVYYIIFGISVEDKLSEIKNKKENKE